MMTRTQNLSTRSQVSFFFAAYLKRPDVLEVFVSGTKFACLRVIASQYNRRREIRRQGCLVQRDNIRNKSPSYGTKSDSSANFYSLGSDCADIARLLSGAVGRCGHLLLGVLEFKRS